MCVVWDPILFTIKVKIIGHPIYVLLQDGMTPIKKGEILIDLVTC